MLIDISYTYGLSLVTLVPFFPDGVNFAQLHFLYSFQRRNPQEERGCGAC